jgi:hypothetical protein
MRVDTGLDSDDILRIACTIGTTTVIAIAYCEHGKKDLEHCVQCENGYVDDTHRFYSPRGNVAFSSLHDCYLAGLFPDNNYVRYIPWRFQRKINTMLRDRWFNGTN